MGIHYYMFFYLVSCKTTPVCGSYIRVKITIKTNLHLNGTYLHSTMVYVQTEILTMATMACEMKLPQYLTRRRKTLKTTGLYLMSFFCVFIFKLCNFKAPFWFIIS